MGNKSAKISNPNVKFYRDEIAPPPNDVTFGEFCEFWSGDYNRLSKNDHYIHWLFPNKETGKNDTCVAITDEEIEIFKNDETILYRYLRAFDIMLEFFGMQRKGNQFELLRNPDERLLNLRKHSKHYMKITRMIKSFRLMGMDDIIENWLQFLLQLIEEGPLDNASGSYHQYWMKA